MTSPPQLRLLPKRMLPSLNTVISSRPLLPPLHIYLHCRTSFPALLGSRHSPAAKLFHLARAHLKGSFEDMEVIRTAVNLGHEAQKTLAIAAEGQSYTYAQLLRSALHISSVLRAQFANKVFRNRNADDRAHPTNDPGFLEGARIGIMAKPCAEFVAGVWGIWLCHGIVVPIALSYPEAELLHVLTDADVSVMLGTQEYQSKLQNVAEKSSAQFCLLQGIPTSDITGSCNLAMDGPGMEKSFQQVLEEVTYLLSVQGDDPGLIIYTSGTTGKPKGVVHKHSGMSSQVKMLASAWEYTKSDRFLHCLPLHHVHGLFNGLLAPLYAGAMVEFLPKFSVRGVWKRWRESYPIDSSKSINAITVFTGVPTMYAWLLQGYETMDHESQREAAMAARQLRLMMSGSSALPQPIMLQWEKLTGHRLLERYGMTEFVMALSNPLHGERKPGTVGKPLQGVLVKIVGDDTTIPEVGELCIKSPSMFTEYWQKPEVTKESFLEDGFFRTGDSATMDKDGYYIILGRTSVDIMKVGGYKLSALEIEAALLEHPDIRECAVLGLPDSFYGEVICAVVVLNREVNSDTADPIRNLLTEKQLREWAKDRLAPYKIPTKLHIWEEMPRNAMGKVNKKELKQILIRS